MAKMVRRNSQNPQNSLYHHGLVKLLVEAKLCKINKTWDQFLRENEFINQIPMVMEEGPSNLDKWKRKERILVATKQGPIEVEKRQKKGRAGNGKSNKETLPIKSPIETPPARRITRRMTKQVVSKIDEPTPVYPQAATHKDPIPVNDDGEYTFPISKLFQSC
jgi:hypothetical protein